ncbi:MAG: type IV pilus assembly protein PilY1 [Desulforhopalus sp.]|jgi:type IV pilus assembly protein PilY1
MLKKIIIVIGILCSAAGTVQAAMGDYCQTPPFISSAVAPNVMLVVDASGSMGWNAYDYGSATFDSTLTYEGYFDPDKDYYENASNVYVEVTGTCPDGETCTDGDQLNFDHMTRVDLVRWAMTGGRPEGCNGSIQRCDPELYGEPSANLNCDTAGCILETDTGVEVKARWERITGADGGLLYQFKSLPLKPRMGSMYFSGSGLRNSNVLIGDFTGSASYDSLNPYKNTIAALNDESPSGSTPLGPAMWATKAYFAQESAVYGGPNPQTGTSVWKNPMYQCFDADNNGNCQGNELVQVPCAKNFVIALTDGEWNRGGPDGSVSSTCNIDTGFENESADPVVPAYVMHKTGYTNVPTGIASYIDTVYGLGLWLAGNGERALQNVSMYGGFDSGSTWPSNLTNYPLTSSGSCKGSLNTPLPTSSADWDEDSDGVPDTYFSATNASQIKTSIISIIDDILKKASSGTAVSVLSSSEGSGANLMQALFYPKRSFENSTEVDWTSDLMNYWYYFDPYFTSMQIREDTVREEGTAPISSTTLDLKQDYITQFSYDASAGQTFAHRWSDPLATTNATSASVTYVGRVPIEKAVPIWRSGFNLWWTEPTSRNIYTSLDGSTLLPFTAANYATLDDYLGETASSVDAKSTINYVRGYDFSDAAGDSCVSGTLGCTKIGRNRTVTTKLCSARKSPCDADADCPGGETCATETHVWKLGDIISSTPKIIGPNRLNTFDSPAPFGYSDETYEDFIESDEYENRQLGFVGANDGMFHAFKLGKLVQKWSGKKWWEIARQEGETGAGGIGSESYSFIPKNVLPYLKYQHDDAYCHVNTVDGPITVTDVSFHKATTCTQTDYWNCPKITTLTGNSVHLPDTSWRTALVGSMGIGGATCDGASPDSDRISTPLSVTDPSTGIANPVGWSSYFALDVTNQTTPDLLWEFSHPDLGATNVGAGIVKVGGGPGDKRCSNDDTLTCSYNSECGSDPTFKCVQTNGRWFAIVASGSTGPITSLEFKGTSDTNLKIFILDLESGALLRTIDTGITNAFAGAITTGAIDLEKSSIRNVGNYQDDAIYISYVKDTTSGGLLRLIINDDIDQDNWTVSKVFADGELGAITTSVTNLFDKKAGKLWLYFAEGRFSYKQDDLSSQRKLFGVEDPCYDNTIPGFTPGCATTLSLTDLKNQTLTPSDTLLATEQGWYINMNAQSTANGAERVITNPTADPLGSLYFLSFAPTDDICGFGGTTYLWGLDYKTGTRVRYIQEGRALVQVSTGEIKDLKLSEVFTEEDNRKTVGFTGIPPTGTGMMVVTNPAPIREYMHIQEQ